MKALLAGVAALLVSYETGASAGPPGCFNPPCPALASRKMVTDRVRLDREGRPARGACVAASGRTSFVDLFSLEPLVVTRAGVALGTTPIEGLEVPAGCIELAVGPVGAQGVPFRLETDGEEGTTYQTIFESADGTLPEINLGNGCDDINVDRAREALQAGDFRSAGRIVSGAKGNCPAGTALIYALDGYLAALRHDDAYCRGRFAIVKVLDPRFTLPANAPAVVRACYEGAEARYDASSMKLDVKVESDSAEKLDLLVTVYDPYDLGDEVVAYFRGSVEARYAVLHNPRGDRRTYQVSIPKLATGRLEYYLELVGGRGVVSTFGAPGARPAPIMR